MKEPGSFSMHGSLNGDRPFFEIQDELIAAETLPPSLRRLRTWELPLSALRLLVAEIPRSTQSDEPQ